ncbi:MAG: DUF4349 domain-containing protein [Nanoarchaeota archaeon]
MDIKKHFEKHWKDYLIGLFVVIILFGGFIALLGNLTIGSFDKSLNMAESYKGGYTQSSSNYNNNNDDEFAPEIEDRIIVRNANVNMESKNYDSSKSSIENSVNVHDVVKITENERKYKSDYRSINYKFKVPADKLDLFISEIEKYGEVSNINIYMLDVTGNYADYTNRLNRYQNQMSSYETMLSKPNLEIEDEIKIQERIDSIENNIFYLQNRIGNLKEDVSYSDVTLNLVEKQTALSEIDFLGLREGFQLFINSVQGAVMTILAIVGFLIPFVICFGIYRGIRRFFN